MSWLQLRFAACLVTIGVLLATEQLRGQEDCSVEELTASDGVAGDQFGVALGIDADLAVVGSYWDESTSFNSGTAFTYHRSNGFWTEEAILSASDGAEDDYLGRSADISGNAVILGAYGDDNERGLSAGSAYVFRRIEDGSRIRWEQEDKLMASDGVTSDFFGISVAINGDRAAIGAYLNDDNGLSSGSAYVFKWDGKNWIQEGKLLADDAAEGDHFGISIDISGEVVVVGAYNDDLGVDDALIDAGSAYVFRLDDTTWIQEQKLTADVGASQDIFGRSVAIDGDYVIVGADCQDPDGLENAGAAYVYFYDDDGWEQQTKLVASDRDLYDSFGYSVALQGRTAVVAANLEDGENEKGEIFNSGKAYVFDRVGSSWNETGILVLDPPAANDYFGYAVAVSDGSALIGSNRREVNGVIDMGAAYVFPAVSFEDCNFNGEADVCEIAEGDAQDCNDNSVPDECESDDCNGNGVPDDCDISNGTSDDCGSDGIPDECIADNSFFDDFPSTVLNSGNWPVVEGARSDAFGVNPPSWPYSLRLNGDPDGTDLIESRPINLFEAGSVMVSYYWQRTGSGESPDPKDDLTVEYLNSDDLWVVLAVYPGDGPDMLSFEYAVHQMPADALHDAFALRFSTTCTVGPVDDWFVDDVLVEIEGAADCNGNGVADTCDIDRGTSDDCSGNHVPDECEPDCDGNGIPDDCDLLAGGFLDCNLNGVPDVCDITSQSSEDCNFNTIPDECEVDTSCENVGIILLSELNPSDFGASTANSLWGYVSPSGREYAILGLNTGTAFVEVTDPINPVIVEQIDGPSSTWRDMRVYDHYSYSGSEGGHGIQVMDLSDIDTGNVTLVREVTDGGTEATHTLALDDVSGHLIRAGGGGNGLRFYSLADPSNPEYVGAWSDDYVHEAQVVTYTDGAYAGREIAFACSGSSGRLYIVDITDKAAPVTMTSIRYSKPAYSHQGWLSPDRRYFYLNDELDEWFWGYYSQTRVFDVSVLENPLEVSTFTSGTTAIDHNLYTLDHLIFEANYTSGLRVFDATDPLAPVEIGYYDTWPQDDSPNFNSLWNNYPYLPSGIVLGSDIERGLLVWDISYLLDCNGNGVVDPDDISSGFSLDANQNRIPDECDGVLPEDCDDDGSIEPGDCNGNGVVDECDLDNGGSDDCNGNSVPDECESSDADGDGIIDDCDGCPDDPDKVDPGFCGCGLSDADDDGDFWPACFDNCPFHWNFFQEDCDEDGIGDVCAIADGLSLDCNSNAFPDGCDVDFGISEDDNANSFPDECEPLPCEGDGNSDPDGDFWPSCFDNCPFHANLSQEDCDLDSVGDVCAIADGRATDDNGNGIPDECEAVPCDGDANDDGTVDPLDSGFVQSRFGCPVGTGDSACDTADQNGDGVVDPLDSGYVLSRFGACS